MDVLQVNFTDKRGGAAQVAMSLARALNQRGNSCWFAVGSKTSREPFVIEIPDQVASTNPLTQMLGRVRTLLKPYKDHLGSAWKVRQWLWSLYRRQAETEKDLGHEDFDFPLSRDILNLPPRLPQLVHLHNLHSNYFDLSYLPELSNRMKTVLTLHDTWLMTGHCGHFCDCERWKIGCGDCPDLEIYVPLKADGTAFNWQRKRDIFQHSKLHLVAPSQWMIDRARESILMPAIQTARVIPNGIDLKVWHPGDRQKARAELGIPEGDFLALIVGEGIRTNPFKDFKTFRGAAEIIGRRLPDERVHFLVLGDDGRNERAGGASIEYVNYQYQPQAVARYYQAADVYIHAARAEAFGLTITEALACAAPVVATGVGGIVEQIVHGETGFLTAHGDAGEIASRVEELYHSTELRLKMGQAAAEHAARKYDLNRMVDSYLDLYREILDT